MLRNGKNIKIQFWENSGGKKFQPTTKEYCKNADGLILVCDSTDKESFGMIEESLEYFKKYKESGGKMILIANKSDLLKKWGSEEEKLDD